MSLVVQCKIKLKSPWDAVSSVQEESATLGAPLARFVDVRSIFRVQQESGDQRFSF